MENLENIEIFAREHLQEYIDLICRLTAIPAPSHREEKRAAFILDYLHGLGYDQAFVDEAKNVICEIKGAASHKNGERGQDIHVFMAHTDTVFPDEEPIPVVVDEECIRAPGVGDDTTNVCAILMMLKYLAAHPVKPLRDTVFVLNSCEEGLGNLKGCRAVAARYGERLKQVVSFDCGYGGGTVRAVGSRRFAVTVRTAGGHSYKDFGAANAIAAAAELIGDLYRVDAGQMPGKTTYNVGVIKGGTSVNTIAQDVKFLYEYRSDRAEGLEMMARRMEEILSVYKRREDMEIQIENIGDRPSMGQVDENKMARLQKRAEAVIFKHTGIMPIFGSGSTDCNIPLSMGIPAICFGTYLGDGQHTREEYVRLDSLEGGLKAAMDMVLQDMEQPVI